MCHMVTSVLNCCVYFKPLLIGQMHFRQKMLLPVWIVIDIPSVYTLLIFLSLCVAVLYTQSGAGSRCCRGNKGSTGVNIQTVASHVVLTLAGPRTSIHPSIVRLQ